MSTTGDPVSEEYRRRGAEVERLAERTISPDHRRQLSEIAVKWREMADEREFWSRRVGG
jgi:hypothetical protein